MALSAMPKTLGSTKTLVGQKVAAPNRQRLQEPRRLSPIRAEASPESSRRSTLGLIAGVGAALAAKPSLAAYGEAANIFGKPTNTSGFVAYSGEGFAMLLPSKWNPSKEKDFPNVALRWEDNFDPLSHVVVTKTKTDKGSIEQFGGPDKFLNEVNYYLGEQSFTGKTISEGGFLPNKVSDASVLDVQTAKDKGGKAYYKYELLVRAADGNEGGRHVLLTAAVGGGNLYIAKVQCGDKRWFKGANKEANGVHDSFTVA